MFVWRNGGLVSRPDRILHVLLLAIAICLGIIAVRPYVHPEQTALAADARFDHVFVVSAVFLYKGNQGVLLMDKRNGNIWFSAKGNAEVLSYEAPVFIVRLPLDKLDAGPQ